MYTGMNYPPMIDPFSGDGHRNRLRNRLERDGWDSLKPFEMVELVLYHAIPRQDLSDLARNLVDRFKTVGGVFEAPIEQLNEIPGMTDVLAEWISLTGELIAAYYEACGHNNIRLSCYFEAARFLRSRYWRPREGMWAVYVDFEFNLITYSRVGTGNAWLDSAGVRQLMTEAIGNGARYVFLVWCAGGLETLAPYQLDELEDVAAIMNAADMDLVDFLLACGDDIRSMNQQGALNGVRALPERWQVREEDGE